MNIFYLDTNPVLSARYACNKHKVKMPTESLQLLSTVLPDYISHTKIDFSRIDKPCHPHTCLDWLRESFFNYRWLIRFSYAQYYEYMRVYHANGKHQGTKAKLDYIANLCDFDINNHIHRAVVLDSPPPLAMGEYTPIIKGILKTFGSNTVTAYRLYYVLAKHKFAKWPEGETPGWFIELREQLTKG